jgi:hypothetical protein
MSKMDGLRAMREARYEQAKKRSGTPATAPKASTAPAAAKPAATPAPRRAPAPEADAQPTAEALCGHRNMSGRTCTREQGHAAKSHRYS